MHLGISLLPPLPEVNAQNPDFWREITLRMCAWRRYAFPLLTSCYYVDPRRPLLSLARSGTSVSPYRNQGPLFLLKSLTFLSLHKVPRRRPCPVTVISPPRLPPAPRTRSLPRRPPPLPRVSIRTSRRRRAGLRREAPARRTLMPPESRVSRPTRRRSPAATRRPSPSSAPLPSPSAVQVLTH